MRSFSQLGLAFALIAPGVYSSNGPALSTGPVNSGNFIRHATSTLRVPNTPSPINGNTVLWTGMGTSNGDLIQGINNNYPSSYDPSDVCGNLGANVWCVAAFTLDAGAGARAISHSGDTVTMEYTYNDSTGLYDQVVSINGGVVSTISSKSGLAEGWGTATECTTKPCGYVPAHSWINTQLTLNTPYAGYSMTKSLIQGATGNMSTYDGGKTWYFTDIDIPAWNASTA